MLEPHSNVVLKGEETKEEWVGDKLHILEAGKQRDTTWQGEDLGKLKRKLEEGIMKKQAIPERCRTWNLAPLKARCRAGGGEVEE